MDQAKATFGQFFGNRLKNFREQQGMTQDSLAARARSVGLPWTRRTVVSLESGSRQSVAVEELILLSHALGVQPTDFFKGNEWVPLTPESQVRATALRKMLAGDTVNEWSPERMWSLPYQRKAPEQIDFIKKWAGIARHHHSGKVPHPDTVLAAIRASTNQAEVKAAARLRADPLEVSFASFALWGRSLTQERDHRAGALTAGKSTAAGRGWITRELLKELEGSVRRKR